MSSVIYVRLNRSKVENDSLAEAVKLVEKCYAFDAENVGELPRTVIIDLQDALFCEYGLGLLALSNLVEDDRAGVNVVITPELSPNPDHAKRLQETFEDSVSELYVIG